MIYFSHRGANTRCVQNTLQAFALAQQQGARYFELDVHLLKDGSLAVHHDYSLRSTARVDVALKDLTAADLFRYPLKNPFSVQQVYVPLLTPVLRLLDTPHLQALNIELKNDACIYPGLEKAVLKQIPPRLLPKILFSSFDKSCLTRLRALAPQVRIGQLTRAFNVQEALALRAESVHINYTRFTPQIARCCHQYQLKVYCYTVNDKTLAARLARQGADGIFTDDITLFEM